jgi:hypothetical protein
MYIGRPTGALRNKARVLVRCKSMTATTCINDITFNEIEWRSHAVLADASQAMVRVAKQSRIAAGTQRQFVYFQIYRNVRSMAGLMTNLLNLYHAPDAIRALEAAPPEQLHHIVATMTEIHDKVNQTVDSVNAPKYWDKLYRPLLQQLTGYNDELASHAGAFLAKADSALILLSKRDQDQLLESLLNPPSPNASLRRAFAGR